MELTTGEAGMVERGTPAFHGYAPAGASDASAFEPPLTIAISRQTGARGRAVARRTADLLGWHLLHQETLEHLSDSPGLAADPHPPDHPLHRWVDQQIAELVETGVLQHSSELMPLARGILEIAAQGNCVILGRGAGCLLPAGAKLHVRLIAPEADRIAFIAQVERLSYRDAERFVRQRDQGRREFISRQFGRSPDDFEQYDLVLNVARLGVEATSAIIVHAAQQKMARRGGVEPADHGEGADSDSTRER